MTTAATQTHRTPQAVMTEMTSALWAKEMAPAATRSPVLWEEGSKDAKKIDFPTTTTQPEGVTALFPFFSLLVYIHISPNPPNFSCLFPLPLPFSLGGGHFLLLTPLFFSIAPQEHRLGHGLLAHTPSH